MPDAATAEFDLKDDHPDVPAVTAAAPPGASAAVSAEPHRRDVQRAALGDLSDLARDVAAVDARIERQLAEATKKSERQFRGAVPEIDERFAQMKRTAEARHDEADGGAAAKYDARAKQLAAADAANVAEIDKAYAAQAKDTKREAQDAVWLADSVQEAATVQADQAHGQAAELVREDVERVDELDRRAAEGAINLGGAWPEPAARPDADADADAADGGDPDADFVADRERAESAVRRLRGLVLPNLLTGFRPIALFAVALAIAAAAVQFATRPQDPADPNWPALGWAVGGTAAGLLLLALALRGVAKNQVRRGAETAREAIDAARASADRRLAVAGRARDAAHARAADARRSEVEAVKARFQPVQDEAKRRHARERQRAKAEADARRKKLDDARDHALNVARRRRRRDVEEIQARHDAELADEQARHDADATAARATHAAERDALQRRLDEGLVRSRLSSDGDGPTADGATAGGATAGGATSDGEADAPAPSAAPLDWSDPAWADWAPPKRFTPVVRFGELTIDLKRLSHDHADGAPTTLALPDAYRVPATLAFPNAGSLLVEADRAGRPRAVGILRLAMARLLTSLPAGRVQFKLIDPVGLGQSFAAFMHLADYDEALVGGRVLTEPEAIERALADLTEHMETVIQKYLRNEFATIDDYNDQAGELAEPYRVLVIADLPAGFSSSALDRLSSIAASGPRCGVYTLISRDARVPMPPGTHLDDLEANSATLVVKGDAVEWKDDVFGRFPLSVDSPPDDEQLNRILHTVGAAAKAAKRIEVPFDLIAPKNGEFWSADASDDLHVPVGRTGATRLQTFRLGRGVAQHALIAGKTGSGKSTLLNALITNLAMWYDPGELEMYLIDFKRGVEFKAYATHRLPHARAVAVESDREFGLSVLQRLDAELGRRGDLFRKAGVQDLAAFRKSQSANLESQISDSNSQIQMPRVLLVIDEFQEFFSEDDRLAQDAALLLDRLVRQGRAFGIHVLLGSQTIGGSGGLPRTTIGQMAVRVALQCSEADSQLILGDNNSAARLLTRPGEAIYNDQGGLVEANSPFQIAWLGDDQREAYLKKVDARARPTATDLKSEHGTNAPGFSRGPIVFEGNAPAHIEDNDPLAHLLDGTLPPPPAPVAYLGEPVAIKEPTGAPLRRQSGANLLTVGQQEEQAAAITAGAMLSLAAARPDPASARFVLLDGTAADAPTAGFLGRVAGALPHEVDRVDYRGVDAALAALHAEVAARNEVGPDAETPSIFLVVHGLQRYRPLRKKEDDYGGFSLSSSDDDDAPKAIAPDKAFAEIIRDGPPVGVHVVAWVDTVTALDRTLDRAGVREFDARVLFQMSAADSSALVDSAAANKLGFYRALYYSEEQGVTEKFRPYAIPADAYLARVATALAARPSATAATRAGTAE